MQCTVLLLYRTDTNHCPCCLDVKNEVTYFDYTKYIHTPFFALNLNSSGHSLQAEGHIISKVASPIPTVLQEHPSSKTQTLCLARATQKVNICCPTVDLCWTLTLGNGIPHPCTVTCYWLSNLSVNISLSSYANQAFYLDLPL